MKYLVEDACALEAEVLEELHEASGSNVKNYYIHGIFSTPGKKNKNGRIYPMELWEKEVQKYQNEIKNVTINSFGENEHPPRTTVDKMKTVMRIVELKIEDGVVKGKAKILNNNSQETNQIKALIDEGMKIGVSSRGVGTVNNGIVEQFNLTTYDIVTDPSDYNANLSGIMESLNESVGNKEYEIQDGIVKEVQICTKTGCTLYKPEDIQEATKEKFSSFISSLTEAEDISGELKIKVHAKKYDEDDLGVIYKLNITEMEKEINNFLKDNIKKRTKKDIKPSGFKTMKIADEWSF